MTQKAKISQNKIHMRKIDFEVTTCFVEFEKKILVLQRGRKDGQFGLWGIPGGKLEKKEFSDEALVRELFEETGILVSPKKLSLLEKAHSLNQYDGSYVLYLYYLKLDSFPEVIINYKEHSQFKWVTLEEFIELPLLVSQGLAFDLVKEKVIEILKEDSHG